MQLRICLKMFKWTDKKSEQSIREEYRRTFNSGAGRKVLAHMLTELHFFDEILDNEEERVLANYARKLLNRLGIWNDLNIDELIGAFMQIAPKEEQGQSIIKMEEE